MDAPDRCSSLDKSSCAAGVVHTCRLNGVEPEAWLTDVIARLGDHPTNRIDELLPWQWQAAQHNALAA